MEKKIWKVLFLIMDEEKPHSVLVFQHVIGLYQSKLGFMQTALFRKTFRAPSTVFSTVATLLS